MCYTKYVTSCCQKKRLSNKKKFDRISQVKIGYFPSWIHSTPELTSRDGSISLKEKIQIKPKTDTMKSEEEEEAASLP